MKIYWVLSYDNYYPQDDNYEASFATMEEAKEYVVMMTSASARGTGFFDNYDIVDISDRL